jgi:hypothetical protein
MPSPPMDRSLRHGSVGALSASFPLTLSAEQRSKVHVLVVEDKYVTSPFSSEEQ